MSIRFVLFDMSNFWRDVIYALRAMRKNPVFAGVAVLTLALGIGANTASFSVIRAVLLKPLEYRNPDQLVNISGGATPVRFRETRAAAQSFTDIGAFTGQESLTLTGGVQPEVPVRVKPLKDQIVGNIRSELWMLFGAVGFVLLIACANIASLLLARANARSREFAVRSALGAARSRLMGQLLAESVLLSVMGGALGMVFAVWSLQAVRHITAFELPRADEIHLDGTVLAFAATLSIVTGILFGLAPSLTASRPDLMGVLRARVNDSGKGVFSVRGALVIGQIGLSIVLLIGAALLIESVVHLRGDNPGFDPANVLTMRVSLPPQRYDSDQKRDDFFKELVLRV